jgi:hypothetical protein
VCLSFIPSGNNYSIYVNKTVLCAELGVKDSSNYPNYGTSGESGSKLNHGNRIILNKQEIGGIISSELTSNSKIMEKILTITGSKLACSEKKLKKNDVVKLVINGNQDFWNCRYERKYHLDF